MKFRYGLICEAYTVDNQTGQISFIKVLESINIPGPGAAMIGGVSLIVIWDRGDDEDLDTGIVAESRVKIVQPEGSDFEESAEFTMDLEIPAGRRILRGLTDINGLAVDTEGTLKFSVQIKDGDEWNEVGLVPIYVTRNTPPETSAGIEGIS